MAGNHSIRRPFNTQDVTPVSIESDSFKLAAIHEDMLRLIELLNEIDGKSKVFKADVERFSKVTTAFEKTIHRMEQRMAALDEKMTRLGDSVDAAYELRKPTQDNRRWSKVGESLPEKAEDVVANEPEYECPECGKATSGDDDRCPHCGAWFGDSDEEDG